MTDLTVEHYPQHIGAHMPPGTETCDGCGEPWPCPNAGAWRDMRKAESAALKAGTHEPAVDDFGNQYLAPSRPSPEPGLDVATLDATFSEMAERGWVLLPEGHSAATIRRVFEEAYARLAALQALAARLADQPKGAE